MRLSAPARTVPRPRRHFFPRLEELAERTLPSATSLAALPLANDLADLAHPNRIVASIPVVSDTVSTAETLIDPTAQALDKDLARIAGRPAGTPASSGSGGATDRNDAATEASTTVDDASSTATSGSAARATGLVTGVSAGVTSIAAETASAVTGLTTTTYSVSPSNHGHDGQGSSGGDVMGGGDSSSPVGQSGPTSVTISSAPTRPDGGSNQGGATTAAGHGGSAVSPSPAAFSDSPPDLITGAAPLGGRDAATAEGGNPGLTDEGAVRGGAGGNVLDRTGAGEDEGTPAAGDREMIAAEPGSEDLAKPAEARVRENAAAVGVGPVAPRPADDDPAAETGVADGGFAIGLSVAPTADVVPQGALPAAPTTGAAGPSATPTAAPAGETKAEPRREPSFWQQFDGTLGALLGGALVGSVWLANPARERRRPRLASRG